MINEIDLAKKNLFPERREVFAEAASSKAVKSKNFEGQLKRCSQKVATPKKNDLKISSREADDARRSAQTQSESVLKKDQNNDESTGPEKTQVVEEGANTGKTEEGANIAKTEEGIKEDNLLQIAGGPISLPLQVENLSPLHEVQNVTTLSSLEAVPEQKVMEMQLVKSVEIAVEVSSLTGEKASNEISIPAVENAQVSISTDKTGMKESIAPLLAAETAPEAKTPIDASSKKSNPKGSVQKPFLIQQGNERETTGEVNDVKRIMQVESQRLNNVVSNVSDKPLPAELPENQEVPKTDNLSAQILMDRIPTNAIIKNDLTIADLDKAAPNQSSPSTQEVFDQIVKKVELFSKENNSEIKIQLKPEFLGKMTIKLIVEDGLVTAKFFTESHQVKQMLESNMNSLKQTLEASGLKVEKTEVNVQLSNGGQFGGGQQQQSNLWQQYGQAGSNNGHRASMEDRYTLEEIGDRLLPVEESAEFSGMNELQGRFSIRV